MIRNLAFIALLVWLASSYATANGNALITRASVSSAGTEGDEPSSNPQISGDGSWVAFSSTSDNFAPGVTNDSCQFPQQPLVYIFQETFNCSNIFLHNTQTATTERLSVAENGEQPDSGVYLTDMTPDARYFAFESHASNIDQNDTRSEQYGAPDAFVFDRQSGRSEKLNIGVNGQQFNDGVTHLSISDDGQLAVFDTQAGLDTRDTNNRPDIYLRDRLTQTTTWVSRWQNDNAFATMPAISGNGKVVAFEGNVLDYIPGATGYLPNLVLYDVSSKQLEPLPISSNVYGIDDGRAPSISGDGRYIAFVGTRNASPNEVFRYDRQTHTVTLVSSAIGGQPANGHIDEFLRPSISADGSEVAFDSNATNLTANANGCDILFVRDVSSDSLSFAGVGVGGEPTQGNASYPKISADGASIVFQSEARNLVAGDTNGVSDVFFSSLPLSAPVSISSASTNNCVGLEKGDIDCNGKVDAADVLAMLRFFARIRPYPECRYLAAPPTCTGSFDPYLIFYIFDRILDPTYELVCHFK